MNALVNEKVINSLLSEKNFYNDFKAILNTMIDEELAKDINDMDCDLIDECTNMLIELEQENNEKGFPVFIPTTTGKKIIAICRKSQYKSLSRGMKASLIAGVILLSGITANAAVYKISGHNIAQEVAESINQKLEDWGIIATADDKKNKLLLDDDSNKVTGIEDMNVGFEDDTTTTTTKATGIEDMNVGFEDDTTTTTTKATGIEDMNVGFEDDTTTTTTKATGIEDMNVGFEDDTTESTKPAVKPNNPTRKQFTITFDPDGGVCDVTNKTVTYRSAIGELPVPTKEGYLFNGWYNIDISYKYTSATMGIMATREALPITNTTIYNLERDAVLTAQWTEKYTVTFDANGGECDVTSLQVNNQGKLDTLPVPTREGYEFDHWYYRVRKNPSWAIYTNVRLTTDTIIPGNITAIASWKVPDESYEGTQTVAVFNANGGECSVEHKVVICGEPYGELPTPTKDGCTFLGWYIGNSINNPLVTADTICYQIYDTTLYALWAEDTYTVTFDANGGECDVESKTVYLGQVFGKLPVPTRAGYEFVGWYYTDRGTNNITAATDVPITADKQIELVAKWDASKIEISFDANGGEIRGKIPTYYYMKEYGSFPEAFCGGYEFIGWFTEPEGGERILETSMVEFTEPTTLYAQWAEIDNAVCVTVHTNRSIEEVYDITYTAGDVLGDIPAPAKSVSSESNTRFLGWFDDMYYGNEVPADTVLTENMDIYAHWTISSGLVKIKINNTKEVYMLNEEFNYDELTYKVLILGSWDAEDLFGVKFVPEGTDVSEFFEGVDTSTVGEHTAKFRFATDATRELGYGVIYVEEYITYTVVDCDHNNTEIRNYIAPTCNALGYSGEVYCSDCNYEISKGTHLDKIPHSDETETKIVNAKDPTCTTDGYTGDIACAACNKVLTEGETIPKLNHPETELKNAVVATCGSKGYTGDTVCTLCGKVIEKGKDIDKLDYHREVILINSKEATCQNKGYTGDYVCADCGTIITKGKSIPKLEHSVILSGDEEPTCDSYGYTGDYICENCGDIITEGEVIEPLPHREVILMENEEATCGHAGYTGVYRCVDCGEIVSWGETIPKLPHGETELVGYKDATCSEAGYTGDKVCTVCGQIAERGKTVSKLPHGNTVLVGYKKATSCKDKGYTGDEVCTVCGEIVKKGYTTYVDHEIEIHNYKAPTCSEEGYSGDYSCKVCGALIYDEKSSQTLDKIDHTYVSDIVKASPDRDGSVKSYCSACGEVRSDSVIARISHIELDEDTFTYTGFVQKPSQVAVVNRQGKPIPDTCYNVTIDQATQPGVYYVTVTFKGDYYEGKLVRPFVIKESVTGITSIVRIANGFKVNWEMVDGADGYEISVMSGDLVYQTLTITKGTTTTATFQGFRYADDTYVILRSYKNVTVDGVTTRVYSDWGDKCYVNA